MLSGPSWAYVGRDGLHGLWGLLNKYTAWNVLITKIRGTFINYYLTFSVSKSSFLAGLLIYCKPNRYYIAIEGYYLSFRCANNMREREREREREIGTN
jgi:hypothetical protein